MRTSQKWKILKYLVWKHIEVNWRFGYYGKSQRMLDGCAHVDWDEVGWFLKYILSLRLHTWVMNPIWISFIFLANVCSTMYVGMTVNVYGGWHRRQFGFLESIFGAGPSPTLYRVTNHSKYLPCYINRIIARCVCLCECKNVMNASEVKKHGKFVSKQFFGHWGAFMWGLFVNTTTRRRCEMCKREN